jgi:hypothetical protein
MQIIPPGRSAAGAGASLIGFILPVEGQIKLDILAIFAILKPQLPEFQVSWL